MSVSGFARISPCDRELSRATGVQLNYLNSNLEGFTVEMDNSTAELSDYFTGQGDR
jgi:hypothetical protein